MGTSRISSDTMVAQDAISKLTSVEVGSIQNQKIEFAGSDIPCMKKAQSLSNQMLNTLGEITQAIQSQAKKVKGLSELIEHRDRADGQGWTK